MGTKIISFNAVCGNNSEDWPFWDTLDKIALASTSIRFLGTLGMFFCFCFADNHQSVSQSLPNDRPICPEETSSFLARVTFLWFTGPTIRGFKKSITFADLWRLKTVYTSNYILERAERFWNKLLKEKLRKYGKAPGDPTTDSTDFVAPPENRKPSLFAALGMTFWYTFFMGVVLRLGSDALSFVQPLVINELIRFVETRQGNQTLTGTGAVVQWHGYFFACCLPLVGLMRTIFFQQQFHYAYVLGMTMRSTAAGLVYRKALRLSNSARQTSTVGEIVNLMSIDAQRLEEAATLVHMGWSAPILIIVSLIMIYQQLGWSVLAGFFLAVLLIPINVVIATKTKQYQTKLMKTKDERIKLLDQTFIGIKVLKMYTWEPAFQKRITELRNIEVRYIRKMAYLRSAISVTAFCAPLFISLATFGAFVLSSPDNVLDAKQAFVSLSLFNLMAFPLSMLPNLVATFVQTKISLRRLGNFLLLPELQKDSNVHRMLCGISGTESNGKPENGSEKVPAINISDATFGWDSETTIFRNLNMSVKARQLHLIVGSVGSGKSSLLSAILREMYRFRGSVSIQGSIAYVPQQAWCMNASVQENILFGRPMQKKLYKSVIRRCCLLPDLEQFPDGDRTEIGERGINLSGGQKQRISLARAVYQQSEIYLLDDPLSAVDSHVANSLFDDVIGPNGMLKNVTRVLVTHRLIKLEQADQIITICRRSIPAEQRTAVVQPSEPAVIDALSNGRENLAYQSTEQEENVTYESYIGEIGTFVELMSHNGPFATLVKTHVTEHQKDDDEEQSKDSNEPPPTSQTQIQRRRRLDKGAEDSNVLDDGQDIFGSGRFDHQDAEGSIVSSQRAGSLISSVDELEIQHLVEEERTETGRIKVGVLKAYQLAYGRIPMLVTSVSYGLFILSVVGSNLWLSYWSQAGSQPQKDPTKAAQERDYYLGVYGAIGVAQSIVTLAKVMSLAYGSAHASEVLHLQLLENIMHAPNAFFDTTPTGRIVNRFSRDIDTVDLTIPMQLRILFITLADVLAAMILISISIPWFLLAMIPISAVFIGVQQLYIRIARQLKRIDSVRRSPIFSHFQESLMGSACIRAYNRVTQFIGKADVLVDESQMARYPNLICFRWLGVVIELLGHLITLFVCIFAVGMSNSLEAGFAGLAITFTLKVANSLTFLIRSASDLESSFVSVERVKEYTEIEHEIGIVGRTGAGKSSLTYALFRLIESSEGRILIDGIDVSKIGLHDLRKSLTIIPQDPILFAGTLRFNLDPSNERSDADIWQALREAHLEDYIKEQEEKLDYPCTEGGANLSVGQRQLVCLARALLGRQKILILDEATAAVDMDTDELIQETIRVAFVGHTILTIAHRLATVLNYDKIIVLSHGEISEYDTPENLLNDPDSVFYSMAKEANLL